MSAARVRGLVLAALATWSCGAPAPAPSSHATELDALERLATSQPVASAPGAPVTPPPAPPASATDAPSSRPRNGRTPTLGDFEFDADMARAYVDREVPKVAAERPETLEFHRATAKTLVMRLRTDARTAAEKNVAVLLFGILTVDTDRHDIARGKPLAFPVDARQLASQAAACRSEFDAWMVVVKGDASGAPEGPCLLTMRQAFDIFESIRQPVL